MGSTTLTIAASLNTQHYDYLVELVFVVVKELSGWF